MEKSIEQLVAVYKQHFSNRVVNLGPKFSQPIKDNNHMKAQLYASYELLVEQRGGIATWDRMTTESIDAVTLWMYDDQHRWLLLYGSLGNGKTTMLKALKNIFPASVYYTAQQIYESFKYNERLPDIPTAKMLLIDDLGTEPPQCKIFGEDRTPITDLLLCRYSWPATTVIATNLSFEDIQARYGDRLADRMSEMVSGIFYDSPSYRGR